MKILITGATGLVGKRLGQVLFEAGHEICIVTRKTSSAKELISFPATYIEVDLQTTALTKSDFTGVDVIINLIGESIDGRWTAKKKQDILDSRILSAQNLLANCPSELKTILSVSAQGYYGDRGDEGLTENALKGVGFLSEVCQQWEAPFKQWSEQNKTRVAIFRFGMVLSQHGGALKKLVSLFQKNLGAVLGSGKQWMSFISLEDLCQIFLVAVDDQAYRGVINAVTPEPLQNKNFTQELCKKLDVLQLPNVPNFVLKPMLGEMSHLVLDSTRVIPEKLMALDFQFKYPTIQNIFEHELSEFKDGKQFLYSEQFVPYEIEKVFSFFADAKNLEAITPDTLKFQIENMSTGQIQLDTVIDYKLKIHGVPAKWKTLIEVWNPPYQFVDTQTSGPYTYWHHTHTFKPIQNGTLIIDEVRFKVPLGSLGQLVAGTFVESDVQKIFKHRRQVIAQTKF